MVQLTIQCMHTIYVLLRTSCIASTNGVTGGSPKAPLPFMQVIADMHIHNIVHSWLQPQLPLETLGYCIITKGDA